MKKVLCIAIAFIAIGFISCDKNESDTSSVIIKSDGTVGGKIKLTDHPLIENSFSSHRREIVGDVTDEIDEIRIRVYNYDENEVEKGVLKTAMVSDGSFLFKLPTPPSGCLSNYLNGLKNSEGFTLSDPDAQVTPIWFWGYKNEERITLARLEPSDIKDNAQISIIYADRDVHIKGVYTQKDEEFVHTEEYDLNFKKGWNTLVVRLVRVEENSANYFYTANDLPDMVWTIDILTLSSPSDGDSYKKPKNF